MVLRPSRLAGSRPYLAPSRLVEWYEPSALIEADPPKDPDKDEKKRKEKAKQEKGVPGGEKKGPDKPGEADQAPPAPVEPRERQGGNGAPQGPPMKPAKMPPIEKEKPPHNLKDIQKKTDKPVNPMKACLKPVTPQKKLRQIVQARASRRDALQDLAQSGLGSFISMRLSPRTRYSGY